MNIRLGPIPLRWVAEHTEYEPGRLFADRQVSGPFASWYASHTSFSMLMRQGNNSEG